MIKLSWLHGWCIGSLLRVLLLLKTSSAGSWLCTHPSWREAYPHRLPLYQEVKAVFLLWLVLPQTQVSPVSRKMIHDDRVQRIYTWTIFIPISWPMKRILRVLYPLVMINLNVREWPIFVVYTHTFNSSLASSLKSLLSLNYISDIIGSNSTSYPATTESNSALLICSTTPWKILYPANRPFRPCHKFPLLYLLLILCFPNWNSGNAGRYL